MPQQATIATGNQSLGVPEQSDDGIACRVNLPFVTVQITRSEYTARYFLLSRPGLARIMGLQHASDTEALLWRQPRIGRNRALVQRCQQSVDGFQSVETFQSKGHHGSRGLSSRRYLGVKQAEVPTPVNRQEFCRFTIICPENVRVGQ